MSSWSPEKAKGFEYYCWPFQISFLFRASPYGEWGLSLWKTVKCIKKFWANEANVKPERISESGLFMFQLFLHVSLIFYIFLNKWYQILKKCILLFNQKQLPVQWQEELLLYANHCGLNCHIIIQDVVPVLFYLQIVAKIDSELFIKSI